MALPGLRLPVPVGPPLRNDSHLDRLVVSVTFQGTSQPNNPTIPLPVPKI